MSNRRRHEGTRDAPEASKCLGVFGLSLYTSERELETEFKRYGPLEKIQVVLDGHTGRSRGFAFVYFENIEDATEARNAMTGTELDGRKIRVDFSITKRAHTPTPGMYMGRPTTGSRSVLTCSQGLCTIRICQVSNNIQTKPPIWNENKSMM